MDAGRSPEAVDILLVNPPLRMEVYGFVRSTGLGRRTREEMVWPQVSLAQMSAMLHPVYKVRVIDANAERIGWPEFTKLIEKYQPRIILPSVLHLHLKMICMAVSWQKHVAPGRLPLVLM